MRGKIKTFVDGKGYGFIRPDDGEKDVFVHVKSIVSPPGCANLKVDQRVEFEVRTNERNGKDEATNVRVVT